ncbi:DinB family protein [Actinoplanes sp. GCM10030250]|uniref:DinB family protein n=1 Tax=Actinoplanes sp. GCM10030250 TaxID=3273376 RepID=UPI00360C0E71
MTLEFPSPMVPAADRAEVVVKYLDFFRETLLAKVSGLPEEELRSSRLASGWTPLELVKHLRWVELRWIEWGFQGKPVDDPWADRRDDRWYVAPEETLPELAGALRAQGAHTAAVLTSTDLAAIGKPGPRWDGAEPPPLERICFHLIQEYARHLGHLDIVAELAGGPVGE